MDRRTALRHLGITLPGTMLMPQLLTSCSYSFPEYEALSQYKDGVIVIGAGAAGLYAATLLKRHGVAVTVLEASDRVGGRVRPDREWADFQVELGAEFIHGQHSPWHDLVKQAGYKVYQPGGREYVWLDGELKKGLGLNNDDDIAAVAGLENTLYSYEGPDISVAEYMAQQGIPDRVRHYAEANIADNYGTDLDRLSVLGIQADGAEYSAGGKDKFIRNASMLDALEYHARDVLDDVVLNAPVTAVDYVGDGVRVTTQDGTEYQAGRAIVAVPLTIMQRGTITFTPALPTEKVTAFNQLGMDAGMKIIMRFSEPFWPDDLALLGNQGQIVGYWTPGNGRSEQHLLTAFVMGSQAEALTVLSEEAALNVALQELDERFGGAPSSTIQDYRIMDWTKHPHIGGAYSYPKVGVSANVRNVVAANLDDKVFFAGEHTHTMGHTQTVHGAIETGQTAVEGIVASLG